MKTTFLPPIELLLLALTFKPLAVSAIGEACLVSGNRLDPTTARFLSACDFTEYCVSDPKSDQYSTCQARRCRVETWPPNFPKTEPLPPKCPPDSFCPDEGSGCLPLLRPGRACQLNRDDQCQSAQPLDSRNVSAFAGPRNSNGAICLANVCAWANVSIGSPCQVDNQAYYAFTEPGEEFLDVVSRDNCAPGGWCDATSLQCKTLALKGETCVANKACESYNCLSSGVCGSSLTLPLKPSVGVAVVVALLVPAILGLISLLMIHFENRYRRRGQPDPSKANGTKLAVEEEVPLATLDRPVRPGLWAEETRDSKKALLGGSSTPLESTDEVREL